MRAAAADEGTRCAPAAERAGPTSCRDAAAATDAETAAAAAALASEERRPTPGAADIMFIPPAGGRWRRSAPIVPRGVAGHPGPGRVFHPFSRGRRAPRARSAQPLLRRSSTPRAIWSAARVRPTIRVRQDCTAVGGDVRIGVAHGVVWVGSPATTPHPQTRRAWRLRFSVQSSQRPSTTWRRSSFARDVMSACGACYAAAARRSAA